MTNCFGCKKKLGVFSERGVKKWIIKNGGKPPEGMDDKDVLCHDCLELIRDGRKLSEDTKQSGGFITEIPEEEKEKIGKSLSSSPKKLIIIAVVLSVAVTLGVIEGMGFYNQYAYEQNLLEYQEFSDEANQLSQVYSDYARGCALRGGAFRDGCMTDVKLDFKKSISKVAKKHGFGDQTDYLYSLWVPDLDYAFEIQGSGSSSDIVDYWKFRTYESRLNP